MLPDKLILWTIFTVVLFNVSLSGQVANDLCNNAIEINGNTQGYFVCVDGTTKGAFPDSNFTSPCNIEGFPKVWFRITDAYSGSHFSLHIKGNRKAILMLQFYGSSNGCNELTPIPVTVNEQYCVLSLNGKIELIAKEVQWDTYYVAVSSLTPSGEDFTVCFNSLFKEQACGSYKTMTILGDQESTITHRPFVTGQTIEVEMNVEAFSPSQNGCQWLQGVLPYFGTGWDDLSFDEFGEPISSFLNGVSTQSLFNGLYGASTWSWFDDVDYHFSHPFYQVTYTDNNGTVDLCHTSYQKDCPETGGLIDACCFPCWDIRKGTVLPAGWFAYGNNGNCNIPGPPVGYDWGDGNSCGNIMGPWKFSFPMTIKRYPFFECDPDEEIDEVKLGFFTLTDGEIGSWMGVTGGCLYDPPIIETLPVICINSGSGPPPTSIPILACTGDTVVIRPLDHLESSGDIKFWGYYGRQSLHNSEGYMPLTDSLTVVVTNNNTIYPNTIPVYMYGYSAAQRVSVILYFQIVVYPPPDATFFYSGSANEISFEILQQVASNYQWSFGDSTTGSEKDPIHIYDQAGYYTVQLILSNHCGADTVEQTITVGAAPVASFALPDTTICVGDTILISSAASMPGDSHLWFIEGGAHGSLTGSSVIITYPDTGYFDIGLIIENALGSDTLFIEDAIHVQGYPAISYSLEVYDSLVVFNFLGEPGQQVEWWLEDSLIATTYVADHVFDSNGIYGITIRAFNECGYDSIHFSIHLFTVSTDNSFASQEFQLYPNPTSGEMFVVMGSEVFCKKITLFNNVGITARTFYFHDKSDRFQLSGLDDLVPGIYVVEVEIGDGRYYGRCVVE